MENSAGDQESDVIRGELMRCPDVFGNENRAALRSLAGTVFAAVATPAIGGAVSSNHRPIWFVNFPLQMSNSQQARLREYQQLVLDFRCWASLKWWTEVFQRLPSSDDPFAGIRQSSEFATAACRDKIQMHW